MSHDRRPHTRHAAASGAGVSIKSYIIESRTDQRRVDQVIHSQPAAAAAAGVGDTLPYHVQQRRPRRHIAATAIVIIVWPPAHTQAGRQALWAIHLDDNNSLIDARLQHVS